MPRITPIHWKVLECIFEKDGFVFKNHEGSHMVYERVGCLRPVVIPKYPEVDVDIIRGLMRTAGMDRDKYFEYLRECK